ncbi:MAG: flagellar assembly protein FliW [Thermoanaerobacterales bacterium]|nr:flagellar assembly protein FliW [Thermoanaerobacterales bacterium]
MLYIQSKRFGEIEIEQEKIISFLNGIMGFEILKKYILIDHPGSSILKWLQSAEAPEIALPIVDPMHFYPDYSPIILKDELLQLEIEDISQAAVLCIVKIPQDIEKASINLKAPVVINPVRRLADQLIAENNGYLVKQPLCLSKQAERRCR